MAANGEKIAGNRDFGQYGGAGSGGETRGLWEAGCGEGGGSWEFGAVGRKPGEEGRRRIGNQKLREGGGGGGGGMSRGGQRGSGGGGRVVEAQQTCTAAAAAA